MIAWGNTGRRYYLDGVDITDDSTIHITETTDRVTGRVDSVKVSYSQSTETRPSGNDSRDREPPNRATRRREAREARLSVREEKRARAKILAERDAAYRSHRGDTPSPRELLNRERRMHAARSSNRNT